MRTMLISLMLGLSACAASAAETNFMSIDRMKAEIIGNSMRGKTDSGDEYLEQGIRSRKSEVRTLFTFSDL